MPSQSNSLGWIQPWCVITSSSSFALTGSLSPLAAKDTTEMATHLNGWNDQLQRENKFLWKTCWRILKIRSRSRQRWPDFCPWRQLLTPLRHIHTSSPPLCHMPIICYTILWYQLEHQLSPPSSQFLLLWLYGSQYTQVWWMFTKVQWGFWWDGLTPLPVQTQ